MSFNSDFERAFMQRSLLLVSTYTGPYDATLLLNCLLGLLIVPKERCIESIPRDPVNGLTGWGISHNSIRKVGTFKTADQNPETLRGLVWRLRNSVAHFQFKPYPERGDVVGFRFTDASGFEAEILIEELRQFVEKLAECLHEM